MRVRVCIFHVHACLRLCVEGDDDAADPFMHHAVMTLQDNESFDARIDVLVAVF